MNSALVNQGSYHFLRGCYPLGWLQACIFLIVTDKTEEGMWKASSNLALDCLYEGSSMCGPFPRLAGRALMPTPSWGALLAPHGAPAAAGADSKLELPPGSNSESRETQSVRVAHEYLIPCIALMPSAGSGTRERGSTFWSLKLAGCSLTLPFGVRLLLSLKDLSPLGSGAEHSSVSLVIL